MKWRHYFPIYHRRLAKFVGYEVHVVEIGIYSGGSLPMWRSYFGPGCQVYGVDIEPACTRPRTGRRPRVHWRPSRPRLLGAIRGGGPPIDVVIDDGGHEAHQQITSLRCLLPRMAMGGVYICEDIRGTVNLFHSFVNGMAHQLSDIRVKPAPTQDTIPTAPSTTQLAPGQPVHQQIASMHHYPRLTVIEKPEREVERPSRYPTAAGVRPVLAVLRRVLEARIVAAVAAGRSPRANSDAALTSASKLLLGPPYAVIGTDYAAESQSG